MHKAWRFFLMVGLMLALPLQGVVAATMGPRLAAPVPLSTMHGGGAHVGHHGMSHGEPAHHPTPHPAAADIARSAPVSNHHDAPGKCSVCALCCPALAVALPSLEGLAPTCGSLRYRRDTLLMPPDALARGLERPPRLAIV